MNTQELNGDPKATARVVKVKTAAEMLSLSRSQVYKLMDQGVLPYLKINSSRRIEVVAVEKLIAASRVG